MNIEQNLLWVATAIAAAVAIAAAEMELPVTAPAEHSFSYEAYGDALKAYVDDNGMVNYKELKADRRQLDAFVSALGTLDAKSYGEWKEGDKIAFWINAYNALTLKVIIDHYPIKVSRFRALIYARNSIRQIPGVWDKIEFTVVRKKMTLEEIEHTVLRDKFNEPRIHVALVCAAMGCPPLRNEPYVGDLLDAQFDDQTRRFLGDPKKFRIDRGKGRVHLSPIFKWFGSDFVKNYGTNQEFTNRKPEQRAVLNYVSQYLNEGDQTYLARGKYKLKYLEYDWSLNEQSPVPIPKTGRLGGTAKGVARENDRKRHRHLQPA